MSCPTTIPPLSSDLSVFPALRAKAGDVSLLHSFICLESKLGPATREDAQVTDTASPPSTGKGAGVCGTWKRALGMGLAPVEVLGGGAAMCLCHLQGHGPRMGRPQALLVPGPKL